MTEPGDIEAARRLIANAAETLGRIPAYDQLDPGVRDGLRGDLDRIGTALGRPDPYAFAMSDPRFLRNPAPPANDPQGGPIQGDLIAADDEPRPPKEPATQAVAARAGALLDELDFPNFVASLVSGTFDAVVDATIRQLEAYADLVSAVAQTVDDFTAGNVTPNQARDWLVEQYPEDLELSLPQTRDDAPTLQMRGGDEFGSMNSPPWLADFDLAGEPLNDEMIETQLVPAARLRVGEQRLQLLATMVMLGMNRVMVTDGRITARLMFRAAAKDRSNLDFAIDQDPGGDSWGTRGSESYERHKTMVSTIGINAQSGVELQADLYGSVELNFVNEALPLDQFVDNMQLNLLQRNAQWTPPTAPAAPVALPAAPAPTPVAAPAAPAPAPAAQQPAPAPAPTPEVTTP